MQASINVIDTSGTRQNASCRRAERAGLAACIALIAGLGIATHLPTASHAAHGSASHTYVVIDSPDTVTGGPGTV